MSTPIYELFIIKNNVAASLVGKSLSESEKKMQEGKEAALRAALNAKMVVFCDSAWADEEHPAWGLVRFPSLAARIEQTRTLREIGWLDRFGAFSLLGTPEFESTEITIPNPIYKLWVVKANPAAESALAELPSETMAAARAKHDAIHQETGSKILVQCDSYWCNEAYPSFGVSVFPNIEASQKVMQTLQAIGWRKYFDSFTLLGIPM